LLDADALTDDERSRLRTVADLLAVNRQP
jgi:hypothetical protein